MKRSIPFLLLVCLTAIQELGGQVVLSEIMFNPLGPEATDEFVEIINLDPGPVDLTGWKVGDGQAQDRLVDAGMGLTLKGGGYGIIFDADYFLSPGLDLPGDVLLLSLNGSTIGSRGLSNSKGEEVCLINREGLVVSRHLYSPDNAPGISEEKIDSRAGDGPENWANSLIPGGTPGRRNSVSPAHLKESVTLTASPDPFSPDGDGFEDKTTVTFSLPVSHAEATLRVYSLQGRLMRQLMVATPVLSKHETVWDGQDDRGNRCGIGIYIILLDALCYDEGKIYQKKIPVVLAERL